jgi:hypothetical protein
MLSWRDSPGLLLIGTRRHSDAEALHITISLTRREAHRWDHKQHSRPCSGDRQDDETHVVYHQPASGI